MAIAAAVAFFVVSTLVVIGFLVPSIQWHIAASEEDDQSEFQFISFGISTVQQILHSESPSAPQGEEPPAKAESNDEHELV